MPHKLEPSSQQWEKVIQGSLQRRLRGETFGDFVKELSKTTPITGGELADILLGQQKLLPRIVDPLIPVYADVLLESNRINTSHLLAALFKHSRQYKARKSEDDAPDTAKSETPYNPAELEYQILDQLTRSFVPGGTRPKMQEEVRATLRVLAEWMSAVATEGDALLQTLEQQSILMIDSLGMLGIAMLENPKVIGIIDTAMPKGSPERVPKLVLEKFLTSFSASQAVITVLDCVCPILDARITTTRPKC
jgi:mediator of RNA polymerase II transcription subunit 5